MVWGVPEVWRQCYSLSMNSGKIGADGWTGGEIEGSTRGPRGPEILFAHLHPPKKSFYRPALPEVFCLPVPLIIFLATCSPRRRALPPSHAPRSYGRRRLEGGLCNKIFHLLHLEYLLAEGYSYEGTGHTCSNFWCLRWRSKKNILCWLLNATQCRRQKNKTKHDQFWHVLNIPKIRQS